MGTGQNVSGGESTGYQLPAVAWMMEDGDVAGPAEPAVGPEPGPVAPAVGPVPGAAAAQRSRFPSAAAAEAAEPVAAGPVVPGPVTPGPVAPAPFVPGPVTPGPVAPGRAASEPAASGLASGLASGPVAAGGAAAFGATGFGPAPTTGRRREAAAPTTAQPSIAQPQPQPQPTAARPSAARPAPEPAAEAAPEPAAEPGRAAGFGAARRNALRRAFVQAPARAARTLAAVTPLGSAAAPGPAAAEPGAPATEERGGRLRGLPRPAVAAAAVGVVLMGLPLVLGRGEGGADPVQALGGAGTSRPDTPVPEPEASGTPAGDPTGTPSADTAPTAAPTAAPADPAAAGAPAPGTPVPGMPEQPLAAPAAAAAGGAPVAQPVGSPPLVRTGAGTGGGPATGGAPQNPAQPPAPVPVQPPAPQPQPQQPTPPAVVTPPAPQAPPAYAAYAGPGCSSDGTGYSEKGRSSGSRDWVTRSDGGGGCSGQFTSVPMSGDRSKDDENSVVWTFTTGRVSTGSCRLSVYIPNNGDLKAVGGAPAYYTVQDGGSTSGSFSINQPQNLGRWVSVGTYPVSGNRIAVVLHTRGIDWGSTAGAHLAASTVKADCTG